MMTYLSMIIDLLLMITILLNVINDPPNMMTDLLYTCTVYRTDLLYMMMDLADLSCLSLPSPAHCTLRLGRDARLDQSLEITNH